MRDLEDAAKPILTPLMQGRPTRLTAEQQTIVAAWAAMKAMVGEIVDRANIAITHHTKRKRMMNQRLPPEHGWAIWIGHYKSQSWRPQWALNPFLVLPERLAKRRKSTAATYFNSASSTKIVGELFIQVERSAVPKVTLDWRFGRSPDRGMLFRIWPPSGNNISWPLASLSDRDAEFFSTAMVRYIERIKARRSGGPI